MMNCNQAGKLLPLHAGGDLDPETAEAMDRHVASCDGCGKRYGEYVAALGDLMSLREAPDLSATLDGLADTVLDRLHAEPRGPAAPLRRPWLPEIGRPLAAAAAILAVAGAAFLAGSSLGGPGAGPDVDAGRIQTTGTSPRGGESAPGMPASLVPGAPAGLRAGDGGAGESLRLRPQELPYVQPVVERRRF